MSRWRSPGWSSEEDSSLCVLDPHGGLAPSLHTAGSPAAQVGRVCCHSVSKGEETQIRGIHPDISVFPGQFPAPSRPLPITGKVCLPPGQSLPSLNVLCAFPEGPSLNSASVSVIPGGQDSWVPVLSAAPSGSSPCCCCPR